MRDATLSNALFWAALIYYPVLRVVFRTIPAITEDPIPALELKLLIVNRHQVFCFAIGKRR